MKFEAQRRFSGLTKGNLSAHLVILEGGGYVQGNKPFRWKTSQTVEGLTPDNRQVFEMVRADLKRYINRING